MPPALFPFRFQRRGYREFLAFDNAVHRESAGRQVVQALSPGGELVVRGRLLFPNTGGSYGEFEAFWQARRGGFEAFLYQAQSPGAGGTVDATVAVAAQVDFPLSRRYVSAASVEVRVDDVLKTLGPDYLLQDLAGGAYALGTSTGMRARLTVAPGAGAVVTVAFDFYYPVRFEGDDLPDETEMLGGGAGAAHVADRTVAVRLRETGPGYSLREAPTAL